MTVKEFLEQHPNAIVHLETGGGNVTISPEQRDTLLSGGSVAGNPGCPGKEFEREITADELLPQIICVGSKGDETRETWYLLSDFPEELSLHNTATDKDRLLTRINDNFTAYVGELSLKRADELFDTAEKMASVKMTYRTMTEEGWFDGYTQFLLSLENPLEALAEEYQKNLSLGSFEELDHVICQLADAADFPVGKPDQPEDPEPAM